MAKKKYKTLIGVSVGTGGKIYKKLTSKERFERMSDFEKLQYKIRQQNAKIRRLMKKKMQK